MKNVLTKYIAWTYGMFFGFILLIGGIMFVLKTQSLAEILIVISSWTPTLVFVVMFRKINPKGNLIDYIKNQFREKIKISTVVWIVLLQFIIFGVSVLFTSMTGNTPITVQLAISWTTLLVVFGDNLIRGPLGEELGWRGYLQNELQKKFSLLNSSIIVGVVWGFWHTPLWLVSGYAGLQLLQYIVTFMIAIVSLSIIIAVFYNMNHNLVIPILIHQLFNYFLAIQVGDLLNKMLMLSFIYFIVAVVIVLIKYKKVSI